MRHKELYFLAPFGPKTGAGTRPPPPASATICWTGDGFRIVDPQLDIAVEDRDLAEAYAKLCRLRARTMEHLRDAGFTPPPVPQSCAPPQGQGRVRPHLPAAQPPAAASIMRLPRGALILVFTAFAFILVYQLAIAPILRKVDHLVAVVSELDSGTVARSLSNALTVTADLVSQMTPERKEELRRSLRIIAHELRPLTLELAPMFDFENAAQDTSQTKDLETGATDASKQTQTLKSDTEKGN